MTWQADEREDEGFSWPKLVTGISGNLACALEGTAIKGFSQQHRAIYDALDSHQKAFFGSLFNERHVKGFLALQGYGGSGKSHLVAASALGLALTKRRALLIANNNQAADNPLKKVLVIQNTIHADGIKIRRLLGRGMAHVYENGISEHGGHDVDPWQHSVEKAVRAVFKESTERGESDEPMESDVWDEVVNSAEMICTTLGACGDLRRADPSFSCLSFDEASVVNDAGVAVAIAAIDKALDRVILVGDPTQRIVRLYSSNNPVAAQMTTSAIERLTKSGPTISSFVLPTNRRQKPELAEYVSRYLCEVPMVCILPNDLTSPWELNISHTLNSGQLGFGRKF